MKAIVIDAWAALAFLRGEKPASTSVRRYLKRAHNGNLRLLMNIVNLGEVYYRMVQLAGEQDAEDRVYLFRRLPIELVQARETLVMHAARLKGTHRMSYADAFAVATAQVESAAILTGDPEILTLPSKVVRVLPLQRN